MRETITILEDVRSAKKFMAMCDSEQKNKTLKLMAKAIVDNKQEILQANAKDMEASKGIISEVMLDRLELNSDRIDAMAKGILDVVNLSDPLGVISTHTLPNGLKIEKTASPMGVIGIIYESRPNVTADAAALSIKAGSCCILRCGKEAHSSAEAIVKAMRCGIVEAGLPENAICLVDDTTRQSAMEMMKAVGYIDLLIPRGGLSLIKSCVENAIVPCIETGTGICHIYVDGEADFDKALNILENAKTSRPSVCNACEVCVVDKKIASEFLPLLKNRLVDDRGAKGQIPVEFKVCTEAEKIIGSTPASENDFDTEFLDYILAIKVCDGAEEAILHIMEHSTAHSDCIVTENSKTAEKFTKMVDSACVYVNASTRFTDGGEFGLGCEMGISTQKLHARGPMGLSELCTYKYVVKGDGQVR